MKNSDNRQRFIKKISPKIKYFLHHDLNCTFSSLVLTMIVLFVYILRNFLDPTWFYSFPHPSECLRNCQNIYSFTSKLVLKILFLLLSISILSSDLPTLKFVIDILCFCYHSVLHHWNYVSCLRNNLAVNPQTSH